MVNDKILAEYATYILKHEARDPVIDRISAKIFSSFRKGSLDERIVASALADSIDLFFNELEIIAKEATPEEPFKLEDIKR